VPDIRNRVLDRAAKIPQAERISAVKAIGNRAPFFLTQRDGFFYGKGAIVTLRLGLVFSTTGSYSALGQSALAGALRHRSRR